MTNEFLSPEESLAKNGESFHWAKKFLGKKTGEDAAGLYAFCRLLDDMADGDIENGPQRLVQIRSAFFENLSSKDSALVAFEPLMKEHDFPQDVIVALIDGLLSDQEECVEMKDEQELLRYAYRVAGTVGILMCKVLGCENPIAHAHAIDLGIAMQLTNIARDVLEDAQMGRRYIPSTWVNNLSAAEIVSASKNPDSQDAKLIQESVRKLLQMAEEFYTSGNAGLKYLNWRAHLSISIAARVYRQIGVQILKKDCSWYTGREITSKSTKVICSIKATSQMTTRFASRKNKHDKKLHKSLGGLPFV